jgi:peptide/nickel transport system permease protein
MSVSQSVPQTLATSSDAIRTAKPPSVLSGVLRSIPGRIGLSVGVLVIAVIVFGRFFTPYSPLAINLAPPYSTPSLSHPFGTDGLGRDVLSRVLTGGDQVVLIPLLAVAIGVVVGGGIGAYAMLQGGRLDSIVGRMFDLFISIPVLLFALVAVAALQPSFWVLVLVVAIADIPRAGRTMRAAVSAQVANDYVHAAQARGESKASILFREIAPNVVAPVASDIALRITYGIIAIATLSFLGLGVQPPTPDWGLMINENRAGITFSPVAVLAPAVALALLSISFNLVAEAITQHVTGKSKTEDK